MTKLMLAISVLVLTMVSAFAESNSSDVNQFDFGSALNPPAEQCGFQVRRCADSLSGCQSTGNTCCGKSWVTYQNLVTSLYDSRGNHIRDVTLIKKLCPQECLEHL